MKIQSLSVLVPTKGCVNNCKFCVSRMHDNDYSDNKQNFGEFYKRLKFSRDNNCNTVILTGTGEPLQNKEYLEFFKRVNDVLPSPFLWVELQTSGVMLLQDSNLNFLKLLGVETISLSLSNIFNSDRNAEICGISKRLYFEIEQLCREIKSYGFNLRLSLNMTSDYNTFSPANIMEKAKKLVADQITFRKLYSSGGSSDVDKWVEENKMESNALEEIRRFIKSNGQELEILPFGATKYSYDGMGVVLDEDCMSKGLNDTYKYLILRENKLFSRWDDKASLIF